MASDPPTEAGSPPPTDSAAMPPPGWYPDSTRPGHTRWWDGVQWGMLDTEHQAPAPTADAATAGPQVVYVPSPAAGQKTNGFAIASMVLGILWIWWLGSILALVFGYVARKQIRRSGGLQGGDGMAIAGIVLGWIGMGVLVLFIVLIGVGLSE